MILLRSIRQLLYDEGYTIKGVQRLLKEQGVRGLRAGEPSLASIFVGEPDDAESVPEAVVEAEAPRADLARTMPIDREGDLRDALGWVEECERILQALARPVGPG